MTRAAERDCVRRDSPRTLRVMRDPEAFTDQPALSLRGLRSPRRHRCVRQLKRAMDMLDDSARGHRRPSGSTPDAENTSVPHAALARRSHER
ncbi:MAG: hypothetical protein LC777_03540 [Actinobacteria bacterium]|nr:hypothetical protein [Actinomycetota bacterium]